jgi:membrane protease YdiL (CAAX protease family)
VKKRIGTAPAYRTDATWRLAFWLLLVGTLAALGYASHPESAKQSADVLYEWSTAIGALIQDGVILVLVLAIAGSDRGLLALRRPSSRLPAWLVVALIVGVYAFEFVYLGLTHSGNEQHLTPKQWEPDHAAAYIVNGLVICLWVPFVEELTYRGLGFSLLVRYGTWPAIIAVGVLFGLAHGLLVSLPVIVFFGCVLAWLRSRTDSVYPGMVLHGVFNLIALVLAVTVHVRG